MYPWTSIGNKYNKNTTEEIYNMFCFRRFAWREKFSYEYQLLYRNFISNAFILNCVKIKSNQTFFMLISQEVLFLPPSELLWTEKPQSRLHVGHIALTRTVASLQIRKSMTRRPPFPVAYVIEPVSIHKFVFIGLTKFCENEREMNQRLFNNIFCTLGPIIGIGYFAASLWLGFQTCQLSSFPLCRKEGIL